MAGNAAEVLDTTEAAASRSKSSWFRDMPDRTTGEHGSVMIFARASKFRPLGHNIRDWTLPVNLAAIEEIVATFDFVNKKDDEQITEPLVILKSEVAGMMDIEKGETRWRAVLYAEGEEYAPGMRLKTPLVEKGRIKIPCVQGNPNRSFEQRQLETITQVGRKPNELEIARILYHYQLPVEQGGKGWSQAQIAEAIGRPGKQSYVSQMVALVREDAEGWTVDPQVRTAMAEGWIRSTTVVNTYRDIKRSGGKAEDAAKVLLDLVAETKAAENAEAEAEADAIKRGQTAPKSRNRARKRVTARDVGNKIGSAVNFTANPRAHNKVNFDRLLVAVRHEASYAASPTTRGNMNEVLKKCGFHEEPVLVNDQGETLPNAAEIKAAWDKDHHDRRAGSTGKRGAAKAA